MQGTQFHAYCDRLHSKTQACPKRMAIALVFSRVDQLTPADTNALGVVVSNGFSVLGLVEEELADILPIKNGK